MSPRAFFCFLVVQHVIIVMCCVDRRAEGPLCGAAWAHWVLLGFWIQFTRPGIALIFVPLASVALAAAAAGFSVGFDWTKLTECLCPAIIVGQAYVVCSAVAACMYAVAEQCIGGLELTRGPHAPVPSTPRLAFSLRRLFAWMAAAAGALAFARLLSHQPPAPILCALLVVAGPWLVGSTCLMLRRPTATPWQLWGCWPVTQAWQISTLLTAALCGALALSGRMPEAVAAFVTCSLLVLGTIVMVRAYGYRLSLACDRPRFPPVPTRPEL